MIFPPKSGTDDILILRIIDGDTILFAYLIVDTARLKGINAPEMNTPEGVRAKEYLSNLLEHGQIVNAEFFGKEKYGRALLDITLPNGKKVSQMMIEDQQAKPYHAIDQCGRFSEDPD